VADGAGRGLLTVAALVVLIAGLRAAAPLIVPFLLSLFLAILSLPLLSWLQRRRVPTVPAVLLTVVVVLLGLGAVLLMVAGSFGDFTEAAPRYQARLTEMALAVFTWLEARGFDTRQLLPAEIINPAVVLDLVGVLLRSVAAVLSNAVLVLLTLVFLLFEAAGLPAKLHAALGGRAVPLAQIDRVKWEVQRYLGVKTLVSLATGVVIGAALALLGVDFPILWGLVAFIFNYVPNLGSIVAAVPPVLLTIVQLGPGHALVVALVYVAVNMLLGNIVEPSLMGRKFGLSTLVVFVSLVFWGWVWGPVGMLLSVPLTMVVKIMLENSAQLRWLATLLEPSPRDAGVAPG
jgi:AI-2 transport protein TqsA